MSKYLLSKSYNGQYWWVLKADNGQTLIKSEMYNYKLSCKTGIASSKSSIEDKNFKKYGSTYNSYYFNQIADNGQVLGTSEMYTTSSNRDAGIESVKACAQKALIEENI